MAGARLLAATIVDAGLSLSDEKIQDKVLVGSSGERFNVRMSGELSTAKSRNPDRELKKSCPIFADAQLPSLLALRAIADGIRASNRAISAARRDRRFP